MHDEMAARSEVALSPVLLVEDNPDDAELTIRALRDIPIDNEIIVARDGQEALERLGIDDPARNPMDPLPAVVILDLRMPRMNGLDVLRRIRQCGHTALLPVVVLTSSMDDVDKAEALSAGVSSYLEKPADSNRFIDAVDELGLHWLAASEAPS